MSSLGLEREHAGTRPLARWLAETVVVLGIIAFGYYAVSVDPFSAPGDTASTEASSLVGDLLR